MRPRRVTISMLSSFEQIPTSADGLKSRGDYCLVRQGEEKCRLLLNAIKLRYVECSKAPRTDAECQNFKVSLCKAFPKFSPCLNGSASQTKVFGQRNDGHCENAKLFLSLLSVDHFASHESLRTTSSRGREKKNRTHAQELRNAKQQQQQYQQ